MPRKSSDIRDGDVPKALKAITISKTTTTTTTTTMSVSNLAYENIKDIEQKH